MEWLHTVWSQLKHNNEKSAVTVSSIMLPVKTYGFSLLLTIVSPSYFSFFLIESHHTDCLYYRQNRGFPMVSSKSKKFLKLTHKCVHNILIMALLKPLAEINKPCCIKFTSWGKRWNNPIHLLLVALVDRCTTLKNHGKVRSEGNFYRRRILS